MLTSEESSRIINCITMASMAMPEGDGGTRLLLEAVRRETAASDSSAIDKLTRREREVFDLLAVGVRNGEIANRLCICSKTVDTHRTHIMRKMGFRGNSHLVLWAVRHGMI